MKAFERRPRTTHDRPARGRRPKPFTGPDILNAFEFMGQGSVFGVVPMQLVFFAAVAAVAWVVLSATNFGFRVFAVGGSPKAARVAGIDVNRVKISAFMLMGALAAFSGILSLAFLPSGQAGRTGLGLELDVIAATIVGGASLSGGEGTILGTILGVLIIGVMRNGLVLIVALRPGADDRPRHHHRCWHRQMDDATHGVDWP